MKKLVKSLSFILLLTLTSLWADVFSQGEKHIGITIASGSGYDDYYTILGINTNYFVVDNLAVGVEYRGWFGGSPSVHELSIPVTYYAPFHPMYRPYAGGFYRHTFMEEPFSDYNVYGFRGGISMRLGANGYSSFGWVQEYYERDSGDGTSRGYPEVSVGLSF